MWGEKGLRLTYFPPLKQNDNEKVIIYSIWLARGSIFFCRHQWADIHAKR